MAFFYNDIGRTVPQLEIDKLREEVKSHNEYLFEESATRNVLIVGKTRSGKSTAVGVLKDPCHTPKPMSIFSETFDPKFTSFALDVRANPEKPSIKYTINVIDTPGLKEVKQRGLDARSDAVILNSVSYCLKNEITKINALLIFISFEQGVGADDVEAIKEYLNCFKHNGIKIGICITRAEQKPQSWRDNLIKELSDHPFFGPLLENNKNIFITFMGCVDGVEMENAGDITQIKRLYIKVYNMRKDLLENIFEAGNQVNLIELPISGTLLAEVDAIFEQQMQILNRLSNIRDFSTQEAKLSVDNFKQNTDKLYEYEGLLNDEKVLPKIANLKTVIGSIVGRMPEDDARKLRHRMEIPGGENRNNNNSHH